MVEDYGAGGAGTAAAAGARATAGVADVAWEGTAALKLWIKTPYATRHKLMVKLRL